MTTPDDVIEQAARVLFEDEADRLSLRTRMPWDHVLLHKTRETYRNRARKLAAAGLLADADCGHPEHINQRQIDACLAGPTINDDPLVALLAQSNDLIATLRARIDTALAAIDHHRWASRDDHLTFIRAALSAPSHPEEH